MAVNRHYSNTAVITSLNGGINNAVVSMVVVSVSGFPTSYPYTLVIDRNTASEELVTVTAAAGLTLTVTRGSDATTAVSHSSGASVEHAVSARDFREPQEHIDNLSTAHGVTGLVMGTTNVQSPTNKNLSSTTNTIAHTVANTAARTALTAYLGMHVIETDTTREYVCTATPSTWKEVPATAGLVSNFNSNCGGNGSFSSLNGYNFYRVTGKEVKGSQQGICTTSSTYPHNVGVQAPFAPNGASAGGSAGGGDGTAVITHGKIVGTAHYTSGASRYTCLLKIGYEYGWTLWLIRASDGQHLYHQPLVNDVMSIDYFYEVT